MILNFQIKIWHRKLLKELNIYSYLTLRTGPISAQNRIWSSNLFVHKIIYLFCIFHKLEPFILSY